MKQQIIKPKGTADVMPDKTHIWQYAESVLREIGRLFGYSEMRFPTFEYTELFTRGVGSTTDVVQKEMYTFLDKGDRSITLRPEGTASVVRAYLENGLSSAAAPMKAYYIVPNFRYEKPQAGRLREHHQFGCECFGAAGFAADVEIISLVNTVLDFFGIEHSVRINSIGCPRCRPAFVFALKEYFDGFKGELCETCNDRLEKNPLRILDCKSEVCKGIAVNAPNSVDFLCTDCDEHFEGVKGTLSEMSVEFAIDPMLVRGLDYYTKTVFEFVGRRAGAQSTICGGGRYDGLIEELGGKPTEGVGFGMGIERLILEADLAEFSWPVAKTPDIYLIGADGLGTNLAVQLVYRLRCMGIAAECDLCGRSVKAQMKYADKISAKYTAVIGQNELESGTISIKYMADGTQTEAGLDPAEIAGAIINV